ncbi:uncharacterized protein LOC122387743 [Amphibalanus amphitrite]|uniref:uncharacterized protein LOC122387743 n=1 Tax=Amphibalanus amphitrite TaxID=1232801 RepID=UPI001C92B329|nr:uncharacterized protein LOC122387743 [Amphibalanus amphitrite]
MDQTEAGSSQNSSAKKKSRWCFVPGCKNTSVSAPNKIFLTVPLQLKARRTWARAARRIDAGSLTSRNIWFCCEDHFDLEQDTENFQRWKMMGGNLRIRKGAVPHKFACQQKHPKKERWSSIMRAQRMFAADTVEMFEEQEEQNEAGDRQMTPEQAEDQQDHSDELNKVTQTPTVETRSAGTQAVLASCLKQTDSKASQTDDLPSAEDMVTETDVECRDDDSDFCPSSASDAGSVDDEEFDEQYYVLQRTRLLCERNPKRYTGIPPDMFFIVDLLASDHVEHDETKSRLKSRDVCLLVLMKVKLDQTFAFVGDYFGISRGYAGKLFAKHVGSIAEGLNEFIYWPEAADIRANLPLAFKARFSSTTCIIDCLEIQIEKPSASVMQSVTYSSYKGANTVKYLVSITPNGMVNFVSSGFGGRVSDMAVLSDSGFLEHLKPGMVIMADRGFKSLEPLLAEKGCRLVRPASVTGQQAMAKADVKWSKQVASLRIHVERAIRRVREFSMLRPHACIERPLLGVLDDCITVACALINVQPPLIKV